MSKPDPFAAAGGAGGLSLPFLPTLATALLLGAASLLCREPAPVAPAAPAAAVAPGAFHAAGPAQAPSPLPASSQVLSSSQGLSSRPPAVIAFAQFPPSLVPPDVRIADVPHPPARVANAVPLRRACTAPHCAEGPPRRPDPFAGTARPAPVEAGAEPGDGALPDSALPFALAARASAARIVGEAAAFVRGGAASLGGSVSALADCLR